MKNSTLKLDDSDYRPAFVFDDVQGIKMKKIQLPADKKEQIISKDTHDVSLDKKTDYLIKKLDY